jgi:hypothetical protein
MRRPPNGGDTLAGYGRRQLPGSAGGVAAGIVFRRLPTPDRHAPDRTATLEPGRVLRQQLSNGTHVADHCRHGIGRSATLAAVILVLEGAGAEDAWDRSSAARGLPVPDTSAQRAFLTALAAIG